MTQGVRGETSDLLASRTSNLHLDSDRSAITGAVFFPTIRVISGLID